MTVFPNSDARGWNLREALTLFMGELTSGEVIEVGQSADAAAIADRLEGFLRRHGLDGLDCRDGFEKPFVKRVTVSEVLAELAARMAQRGEPFEGWKVVKDTESGLGQVLGEDGTLVLSFSQIALDDDGVDGLWELLLNPDGDEEE